MESNKLIICGTSRKIDSHELIGAEVWSVGKTSLKGCDRYYELHNLPSELPRYDYSSIPISKMKALGLPLVNSVCVMLAHAIVEDRHTSIKILASPLETTNERIAERPAVAFLLGYAKALGYQIYWEDGPNFNKLYMGG